MPIGWDQWKNLVKAQNNCLASPIKSDDGRRSLAGHAHGEDHEGEHMNEDHEGEHMHED
jgi:hypothetical protein